MDAAAIRITDKIMKVLDSPSAASVPAPAEGSEKSAEPPPLRSEAVQQLVEDIQKRLNLMNVSLNFSTYGKTGEKIAVTVTEKDSGRVIREIPPKEIQNLQMKMDELAGMIFSEMV
jgi:flagellar protein FlaG